MGGPVDERYAPALVLEPKLPVAALLALSLGLGNKRFLHELEGTGVARLTLRAIYATLICCGGRAGFVSH
jgi:hypothetical protein